MRATGDIRDIKIQDYSYDLPDDRIAQFPLAERDRSKLLIYRDGQVSEDVFFNLAEHLPYDSLVVFNETKVIHARLQFVKASGSRIEIFCLEPLWPFRDHIQAFQQKSEAEWQCLVGNSKRWKSGKIKLFTELDGKRVQLEAERMERMDDSTSRIRFTWSPENIPFSEMLEAAGKMPLPPYINRNPVESDEITYQTIYARKEGSVAAPTAGLHFSDNVLNSLSARGIEVLKLTLHVGAGTFKPVISQNISGHEMHAEQVYVPLESLKKLKASLNKPIIAVGTTTVRLLESLYWHGVKVIQGLSDGPVMDVMQWDPYDELKNSTISRDESLDSVIRSCEKSGIEVLHGNTSLLIAPGYEFRFPEIMVTNFHQPKSTLLLLIAAFIGENWKSAYRYALEQDFRFLSYGDSCLFFRYNK